MELDTQIWLVIVIALYYLLWIFGFIGCLQLLVGLIRKDKKLIRIGLIFSIVCFLILWLTRDRIEIGWIFW